MAALANDPSSDDEMTAYLQNYPQPKGQHPPATQSRTSIIQNSNHHYHYAYGSENPTGSRELLSLLFPAQSQSPPHRIVEKEEEFNLSQSDLARYVLLYCVTQAHIAVLLSHLSQARWKLKKFLIICVIYNFVIIYVSHLWVYDNILLITIIRV